MAERHKCDRDAFIKLLGERFPEVVATFTDVDEGLLHLEVAAFRICVERAMDEGRLWDTERYLRFVDEILPLADEALDNAIGVSFIEDFALGECTAARRSALKERAPQRIRDQIVAIHSQWR